MTKLGLEVLTGKFGNIEQQKLGGRLARVNEKKGDRDLERRIKIFSLEEQHENFVAAVTT